MAEALRQRGVGERDPQNTIQDRITLGNNVIICQDADIRGDVSIGSGTIIHAKAAIHALGGPITVGKDCIIEERVVLLNERSRGVLSIGDNNLFESGCRIEAASVGSFNVFEPKSRVPPNVAISDWCCVGAGCSLSSQAASEALRQTAVLQLQTSQTSPEHQVDKLPNHTTFYGATCERRIWSGESLGQITALHAKHLLYLREMIPRFHKVKQFPPEAISLDV